jgi:DNA-binding response OmpR family regulator
VLSASDGEEALGIARQRASDIELLVTDVVMPRLGGPDLARELRARRTLPVLFMSGYHERHEELAGELLLEKPFTIEQLLRAVDAALPRPAGARGAGSGDDPATGTAVNARRAPAVV